MKSKTLHQLFLVLTWDLLLSHRPSFLAAPRELFHLDKAPLAVSEQASGWPKCELKPEETVAFVGWQFFLIKPAWHFINATEASVPLQILRMMDNHFCSLTHTRDIPPCQLNIPTQASLKDCLLYEETAWKRNSSICAKTESILKSSRQKLEEAEHTRNE